MKSKKIFIVLQYKKAYHYYEVSLMKIKSKLKDYEVFLEEDFAFVNDLVHVDNSFYVVSKTVYTLYHPLFSEIEADCLYVMSSTEENKTINTALSICEKITNLPAKRNAKLVSFGGGVIQDITGFVANIMYRGIDWIFVPTTLLSACDSCIGGKTSLNYNKYKNLLGTFYSPNEIHIWSGFFQTLSEGDFKSGLGELIKFGFMSGLTGFYEINSNITSLLEKDLATIDKFVEKSLLYKKAFIEADEFDRGERLKLNYAHTFGHAIEVISNYKVPHGTAVAIGMIMANRISYKRGYITEHIIKQSERLLMNIIDVDISLLEKPLDLYISAIKKDKKQVDDTITAVLITKFEDDSDLAIVHDVNYKEVEEAIQYAIELYRVSA